MKLPITIFAIALCLSISAQAGGIFLSAEFSGTTKAGEQILIKQLRSSNWEIQVMAKCKSYPCDEKSQTKTKVVQPTVTADSYGEDSEVKIILGDFLLTRIGPSPDHRAFWELRIPRNSGKYEKIEMQFRPRYTLN